MNEVNMTSESLNTKRSLQSWIAWTIYFVGWITWFASMSLKADYLFPGLFSFSNTYPPPSSVQPASVFVMLIAGPSGPQNQTAGEMQLGLSLCVVYDIGVLFCVFWPLFRMGPQWLDIIGRVGALGALSVWAEVAFASQYFNFHVLPGYPVLAVASTLICIGVWLIPPRLAKSNGQIHKPMLNPGVSPPSN
ncbi:MAG TPA: hypothetical protein VMG59_06535 [Phycisphaerae bacterium]|nr:hypothetical protein [Phycisphaerae bacterium]